MRIKLTARWVQYLRTRPESGMGYQRIDVRLSDGRELMNVLAFNGEEIEVPEPIAPSLITEIRLHTR